MSTALTLPAEFKGIANILQLDAQLLGDYSVKAVNGRQLQEGLEIVKKHTDWAKAQVDRLGLIEGQDYEIILLPLEGKQKDARGGHNAETYIFTIDAAKIIAGQSRGKNGLMVMKYFLHMEKIAQQAFRNELSAISPSVKDDLEILAIAGKAFQPGAAQAIMHNGIRELAPHLYHMLPELPKAEKSDVVHNPETGLGLAAVKTMQSGEVTVASKVLDNYSTKIIYQALENLGYGENLYYVPKSKGSRVGKVGFWVRDDKDGFINTKTIRLQRDTCSGLVKHTAIKVYTSFVANIPQDVITKLAAECARLVAQA